MERVIKEAIKNFLRQNNLISKLQHGFCNGKSTVTNLVEFLDKLTQWYDEGHSVDVAYFDFAKAFYVIDHKLLVSKVDSIWVRGRVLAWLSDWLRGRQQRVIVEGEESTCRDVPSSVVQGSVLSGLLFVIFINDIDVGIGSFLKICQ